MLSTTREMNSAIQFDAEATPARAWSGMTELPRRIVGTQHARAGVVIAETPTINGCSLPAFSFSFEPAIRNFLPNLSSGLPASYSHMFFWSPGVHFDFEFLSTSIHEQQLTPLDQSQQVRSPAVLLFLPPRSPPFLPTTLSSKANN